MNLPLQCVICLKFCICVWKCVDITTPVDLADKSLQKSDLHQVDDQIETKFKILFDGYQKMFDQSLSKSKDLVDLVDILGSMHKIAELDRIAVGYIVLRSIEPPSPYPSPRRLPNLKLDDYLSDFLQDRDRSQLYYYDPKLQHISICRHLLFLLETFNGFNIDWIES